MKLAYHDLAGDGSRPATLVLHREAVVDTDAAVAVARRAGVAGRVVAPYGDYAYYPSGMEIGGLCWYRLLPGYAGTDPLSVAKAIVQVGDVLDDTGVERPLLIGWGQGAIVAVGVALVAPDRVGAAVGVDPPPAHLPFLPPAGRNDPAAPPVLLVAPDSLVAEELQRQIGAAELPTAAVASWYVAGGGLQGDQGRDVGQQIATWWTRQEVAQR